MLKARTNLTAFCFNDCQQIFACGGWVNKSADTNSRAGDALSDVELFSLEYGRWKRFGKMIETRFLVIIVITREIQKNSNFITKWEVIINITFLLV